MVTDKATVGRMVRAARTKQALRIDDAAALCGVSVALLSALEGDAERSVKLDKLLTILDGLGLALLVTDKKRAREIAREQQNDS
jgi:transcriptional regulator with XRE-family HTH domain